MFNQHSESPRFRYPIH